MPSPLRVPTTGVEARVLDAIDREVMTPETIAYAVETALAGILAMRATADPKKLRRELERLQAERDRLLDAYTKGLGSGGAGGAP